MEVLDSNSGRFGSEWKYIVKDNKNRFYKITEDQGYADKFEVEEE